jgi:hypothetical protein
METDSRRKAELTDEAAAVKREADSLNARSKAAMLAARNYRSEVERPCQRKKFPKKVPVSSTDAGQPLHIIRIQKACRNQTVEVSRLRWSKRRKMEMTNSSGIVAGSTAQIRIRNLRGSPPAMLNKTSNTASVLTAGTAKREITGTQDQGSQDGKPSTGNSAVLSDSKTPAANTGKGTPTKTEQLDTGL